LLLVHIQVRLLKRVSALLIFFDRELLFLFKFFMHRMNLECLYNRHVLPKDQFGIFYKLYAQYQHLLSNKSFWGALCYQIYKIAKQLWFIRKLRAILISIIAKVKKVLFFVGVMIMGWFTLYGSARDMK